MSRPWLSNDYKRTSKSASRSKSPDSDDVKKRTKVDQFGRTVPAKSRSRSRSRSRDRSHSRVGVGKGRGYRSDLRDSRGRERLPVVKRRRKHSGSSTGSSSPDDLVRPAASTKTKFQAARVFVANISARETGKQELTKHFAKYGEVYDVLIHPKNYAFVQYGKEEHARLAVEGENGSTFKGQRMDVKMAMEGKKEPRDGFQGKRGRGRGRGRRDPSRDRDWYDRRQESPEPFRHERSKPPPPMYPDEFGMRDPFYPPPPDPFLRGYSDPWMVRPDDPYRMDPYADPYREGYGRRAPPPALTPAPEVNIECQIYVVSAKLRPYGEAIEKLVKENSIITAVTVMPEGRTATDMLADLTDRNGLFAVFVNAQNEMHRSLTLNILHGTPQEHRNMPMNDAVALIGQSFEEYVDHLREEKEKATQASSSSAENQRSAGAPAVSRVFLPPTQEVTYLLNLLADNRALTVEELNDVIKYLKERRSKLIDAESRPLADDGAPVVQPVRASEPQKGPTTEELTNKILSIFSSAGGNVQGVMPPISSSTRSPTQQQQMHVRGAPPPPPPPPGPSKPQTSSKASSVINFDNPNVQKALDNLIQNSPALIKSLGSGASGSVVEPQQSAPSIETVSQVVGRSSMIGYSQGKTPGGHGEGNMGSGSAGGASLPTFEDNVPTSMGMGRPGQAPVPRLKMPQLPPIPQPDNMNSLIATGNALLAAAASNIIASLGPRGLPRPVSKPPHTQNKPQERQHK